ncbi:MAG: hypothetical protein UT94_C0045G0011 [Candidatus Uhrbacteria bacterium GW2011_GWF2_40_263]|nr:MAG: hypothetical protein UT94_C0045G0011 [Candidatus Uhrbacteria bacterium GW2011_GWF2_40_263]
MDVLDVDLLAVLHNIESQVVSRLVQAPDKELHHDRMLLGHISSVVGCLNHLRSLSKRSAGSRRPSGQLGSSEPAEGDVSVEEPAALLDVPHLLDGPADGLGAVEEAGILVQRGLGVPVGAVEAGSGHDEADRRLGLLPVVGVDPGVDVQRDGGIDETLDVHDVDQRVAGRVVVVAHRHHPHVGHGDQLGRVGVGVAVDVVLRRVDFPLEAGRVVVHHVVLGSVFRSRGVTGDQRDQTHEGSNGGEHQGVEAHEFLRCCAREAFSGSHVNPVEQNVLSIEFRYSKQEELLV